MIFITGINKGFDNSYQVVITDENLNIVTQPHNLTREYLTEVANKFKVQTKRPISSIANFDIDYNDKLIIRPTTLKTLSESSTYENSVTAVCRLVNLKENRKLILVSNTGKMYNKSYDEISKETEQYKHLNFRLHKSTTGSKIRYIDAKPPKINTSKLTVISLKDYLNGI